MMAGQHPQQHSSSSISDGSELRYQKAVKEISKLINANSNVRRELDHCKHIIANLQQQKQAILRDSETLRRENQLQRQKNNDMQFLIKKLEETIRMNAQNVYSQGSVDKIRRECARRIEELEEKLDEQGFIIIKHEDIVGQRQKEILELKNQIQIYQRQNQEQRQKYERIKTEESQKYSLQKAKCLNCQRTKEKQKKAVAWAARLSEENILLNKKIAWLDLNMTQRNSAEVSIVSSRTTSTRPKSLSAIDYFKENYHDRIRELSTEKKSQAMVLKKKLGKLEKVVRNKELREKLIRGKERQSKND